MAHSSWCWSIVSFTFQRCCLYEKRDALLTGCFPNADEEMYRHCCFENPLSHYDEEAFENLTENNAACGCDSAYARRSLVHSINWTRPWCAIRKSFMIMIPIRTHRITARFLSLTSEETAECPLASLSMMLNLLLKWVDKGFNVYELPSFAWVEHAFRIILKLPLRATLSSGWEHFNSLRVLRLKMLNLPVPSDVDARCARLDDKALRYTADSYDDLSVVGRRPVMHLAVQFMNQLGFHQCTAGCCTNHSGTLHETCCFLDALLCFQLHIELAKDPLDASAEYFFACGEEALKKHLAKKPSAVVLSLIFSDALILDILVSLSLPSRLALPSKHYPTFYQYVFPYREMASDAVRYEQRPFCSLSLFVDLLDFIDPHTRVLIVEGGAHIGDCTLLAAHKLPHARIIAFEPMRDAYELFRRSVVANQWDDRISVVRKALSDDGHNHVSITHYPGRSAASSASPRHKNFCSSADHHTCVVHNSTATTLTTALQGYGVVDVMKLSLEGLEMPALRGARALLAARRLCILFTNAKNVLLDAPRGAPVSEDFFSLMKEGDMDIWVVRTRDAFLFAFSRLATPADVQEVFDSKMVNGVRGVDYLVAVGRAAHCTYMQDVFDAFLSQS